MAALRAAASPNPLLRKGPTAPPPPHEKPRQPLSGATGFFGGGGGIRTHEGFHPT